LKKLVIILMVFLILGCLSTHHIIHDQANYDQINILLQDKKGIFTLINDEVFIGYEVTIRADSTNGIDIKRSAGRITESNPWQIATSDIIKIEIKDHIRGGLIGFGVGFGLGVICGILLAEPVASLNDKEATLDDYFLTAGILGLVGGVTFGLPGLIIGYNDKYILTPAEK